MIESQLKALGSLAEVARACGVKKGTPWAWKERGYIPARYWPALIKLGREKGVNVDVGLLIRAVAAAAQPRTHRAPSGESPMQASAA